MDPRPPQEPLIKSPEQEPILSFEEFTAYNPKHGSLPTYNNFIFYFIEGIGGEMYRTKEHYKKFASENQEMASGLCKKMQELQKESLPVSNNHWKPLEKELYEAYKIMRSYAGVSDRDLTG